MVLGIWWGCAGKPAFRGSLLSLCGVVFLSGILCLIISLIASSLYRSEVPNCPGLLLVHYPVFPAEVSIYFYFYIPFLISIGFGGKGDKKLGSVSQPSVTRSLNFPALPSYSCVSCVHAGVHMSMCLSLMVLYDL